MNITEPGTTYAFNEGVSVLVSLALSFIPYSLFQVKVFLAVIRTGVESFVVMESLCSLSGCFIISPLLGVEVPKLE
jgi:hypothetical protein